VNVSQDSCSLIAGPMRSLQIGVHAYECLPGLVFVRVPNERGRYMLVDRCVAEVDCPHCHSIAGEPCHKTRFGGNRVYCVGTHAWRRSAWQDIKHGRSKDKPKVRLASEDVAGALADLDVEVTRK
jgi:hypothetical protein